MSALAQQLQAHFGFRQFRPLQQEIIADLMAGHSVVGILPTGAGKSLCYQLPALLLPGVTIVISPLISLMKDQTDSLVSRGIQALAINSHDTLAEGRSKLAALVRGEAKMFFVAPERLAHPAFLSACQQAKISLLAVDEAHCVSQWGHDFRPDYLQIPDFHRAVGQPPVLALTATARPDVQQDLSHRLGIPHARLYRASADRPNLWIGLEACRTEAEREAVIGHLLKAESGSAVVYVTSRKDAENLAAALSHRLGAPVACYHAGMEAEERTAIQNQFMSDLIRVVVATNAFGMGIDKPDIRTVLHAGAPDSLEAYFQEIGRAGRDGLPARCTMVLIPGRDVKSREYLVKNSGDPHATERFRRVCRFIFMEGGCRRSFLMRYFGEQPPEKPAACCSNCHPLTIAGREELAAAQKPSRRRKEKPPRSPVQQTAARPVASQPSVPSEGSAQLFERLRQWRRAKASEQGVPPFVVFGDKDLMGIAEAAPTDLMALAACRGVGPAKLKVYGEELLAEIARFVPEETVAPQEPATPASEAPKRERAELLAITGQRFAEGRSAQEIASEIDRSEGTVWQYLLEWIGLDESNRWKDAVRQVISREAYREIVGALLTQEGERLKPVYESLQGRYSYEQIRVAKAVQARPHRET